MKLFTIKVLGWLSILLAAPFCISQTVTKKQLKPEDFKLWSTMAQQKISSDGSWLTYTLQYEENPDTLFVKHIKSNRLFNFPNGSSGKFSDDGRWFFTVQPDKGVGILDLQSGKLQYNSEAKSYELIAGGKYIVFKFPKGINQGIEISRTGTQKKIKIDEVSEFNVATNGKVLAYVSKFDGVQMIHLSDNFKTQQLCEASENKYKNLTWDSSGNALAFLQEIGNDTPTQNHRLFYYKNIHGNSKSYILDPSKTPATLNGKSIVISPAATALTIAPDGERVFFHVMGRDTIVKEKHQVQVWNAASKWEYPRMQYVGDWHYRAMLVSWSPEENKVTEIGTPEQPFVLLTSDRNFALSYNPMQYEPSYEVNPPADFWITDLQSGDRKMLLQQQNRTSAKIGNSPNGRFISYFRDKNWWMYDCKNDRHRNVTIGLSQEAVDGYDYGGEIPSFASPGWSADSKYLIIYGKCDIWLIPTDGTSPKQITKGKQQDIRYRIYKQDAITSKEKGFNDFSDNVFDLSKGLILETLGSDQKSGYSIWSERDGLQTILYEASKVNKLMRIDDNRYVVVRQNSQVSPQLITVDKNGGKSKIVVETNKQQNDYSWGNTASVSYKNKKGEELKATLCYPADFKKGNKYPMIVYIYERQSQFVHQYHNPTFYKQDGFSPINYTSAGYFVLYPDITYEIGEPGNSALDCVEAAVDAVIRLGTVDEKSIGLVGHSFGGYETSLILGKSKKFAAAVAGAACTDLVGHVLTTDLSGRAQFWRYESDQMRMGRSLYEDFEGYIDNSPITHAANISTPLLSWSGGNDRHVNWEQSVALHLAMRRLNKKHLLLLYPGQGHVLTNPEFQKQHTLRMKAWFDLYLKNIPLPTDFEDMKI